MCTFSQQSLCYSFQKYFIIPMLNQVSVDYFVSLGTVIAYSGSLHVGLIKTQEITN